MTTTVYTYDNGANFTYDANLIEFTGGVAKLKSQIPNNVTFYANYNKASFNGYYGLGSLVATQNGTPALTSNELDLSTGTSYLTYPGLNNADALVGTGTIGLLWRPTYTGSPATQQTLISIGSTGTLNNLAYMYHATDGAVYYFIYDSTGTLIHGGSTGAFSPTTGNQYYIELNWDVVNAGGASRLFIDGVQLGATKTGTGTRSSAINNIFVGAFVNGAPTANLGKIDDVVLYSVVQHTANFSPSTFPQTLYSTSNPSILTDSMFGATVVESAVLALVASGNDTAKMRLVYNGQEYYMSGGNLIVSDGSYAQSSDAADFVNVDIDPDSLVKARVYLHSDDGDTTPSISTLTIEHGFYEATNPLDVCTIHGYVFNNTSPVQGAEITFYTQNAFNTNGRVVKIQKSTTTGTDGFFSVNLPETATSSVTVYMDVKYTDAGGFPITKQFKLIVPNQDNAKFDFNLAA